MSIVIIPDGKSTCCKGSVCVNIKGEVDGKVVKSIKLALSCVERVKMRTANPADPNTHMNQSKNGNNFNHTQLLDSHDTIVRHEKESYRQELVLFDVDKSKHPVACGINDFPFEFAVSDSTYLPTTLYTEGRTQVQYHLSAECVFDEVLVTPLNPWRNGKNVVKFRIVKSGGVRVRNSSRLNSREIGFLAEGTICCIDQKEVRKVSFNWGDRFFPFN